MESTGISWRPVYQTLEGSFELLLVNAQHVKMVPGRKTDMNDCQWIAELFGARAAPVELRATRAAAVTWLDAIGRRDSPV